MSVSSFNLISIRQIQAVNAKNFIKQIYVTNSHNMVGITTVEISTLLRNNRDGFIRNLARNPVNNFYSRFIAVFLP